MTTHRARNGLPMTYISPPPTLIHAASQQQAGCLSATPSNSLSAQLDPTRCALHGTVRRMQMRSVVSRLIHLEEDKLGMARLLSSCGLAAGAPHAICDRSSSSCSRRNVGEDEALRRGVRESMVRASGLKLTLAAVWGLVRGGGRP